MGRKVVWTRQALDDLDEIERFIQQDSDFYARAVVQRLLDVAESVADQPQMGRRVPEFDLDSVRERIVYSYRVVYRLSEFLIEIVAVIHGSRLIRPVAARLISPS